MRRLLRLAGDALEANGVRFATLAGASAAQREAALHDFIHNPDCTVLTVGGLAWLHGWRRAILAVPGRLTAGVAFVVLIPHGHCCKWRFAFCAHVSAPSTPPSPALRRLC